MMMKMMMMITGCPAGILGMGIRGHIVNGQYCANPIVVGGPEDFCIAGAPYYDPEGLVCANDGQTNEAYCSYDVGPRACARCNDDNGSSHGGSSYYDGSKYVSDYNGHSNGGNKQSCFASCLAEPRRIARRTCITDQCGGKDDYHGDYDDVVGFREGAHRAVQMEYDEAMTELKDAYQIAGVAFNPKHLLSKGYIEKKLKHHPAEKDLTTCYELPRQRRRACLKELPHEKDMIYFAYKAYYYEIEEANEWLNTFVPAQIHYLLFTKGYDQPAYKGY